MIDAVNEAKTYDQHRYAENCLSGWRKCMFHLGLEWSGTDDDIYTMAKYGKDRPMCCGVLLDWEPTK